MSSRKKSGKKEEQKDVFLMVYDLSSGFTRQLMRWLPLKDGKNSKLETIWHTSIIAYGYEYFYGGGLIKIEPGDLIKYWHIKLVRCDNLGEPNIGYKDFEITLKNYSNIFSKRNYNLTSWNCNHFTNFCMRKLVGRKLSIDYLEQVYRILEYSPLAKSAIQLYKILQSLNTKPLYQRLFQQAAESEEDDVGDLGSQIECGFIDTARTKHTKRASETTTERYKASFKSSVSSSFERATHRSSNGTSTTESHETDHYNKTIKTRGRTDSEENMDKDVGGWCIWIDEDSAPYGSSPYSSIDRNYHL